VTGFFGRFFRPRFGGFRMVWEAWVMFWFFGAPPPGGAALISVFCFFFLVSCLVLFPSKEVFCMSLPFHDPEERLERRETTVTFALLGCLFALLRLRRHRRR
jgi:hypothetical protein